MTSGQRTFFADERHAEVLRLLAAERRVESAWLARCFGVSAESIRGLTTPDADEALVKHEMLAATRQRVFLVDTSKFGRESRARHAMLTHVDVLVTDDAVTPEQCERLLAVDVTVEVAR